MRLLLIEDYRPLQKSLGKGLREAGFAVDTTGDGNEGLWYAMSNDYDVIILDLMLPGMDGLQILKELRAKGRKNPVLVLTAKDTLEDRVTGLGLAMVQRIIKALGGHTTVEVQNGGIFTVRLTLPDSLRT